MNLKMIIFNLFQNKFLIIRQLQPIFAEENNQITLYGIIKKLIVSLGPKAWILYNNIKHTLNYKIIVKHMK